MSWKEDLVEAFVMFAPFIFLAGFVTLFAVYSHLEREAIRECVAAGHALHECKELYR